MQGGGGGYIFNAKSFVHVINSFVQYFTRLYPKMACLYSKEYVRMSFFIQKVVFQLITSVLSRVVLIHIMNIRSLYSKHVKESLCLDNKH